MRTLLFAICAAAAVAGCAAQEEETTQDIDQSIRDFIELRELEPVNEIRTSSNDSWREITERFIIYEGRRQAYLVGFVRRCWELNDQTRITPDVRWDNNTIRTRFDTIRGCRIETAYLLNEAEVAELENIGEQPGSRN